jgi:hypothetical protein
MNKKYKALVLAALLAANASWAETLSIYDDSFTMVNVPGSVGSSGILSGRWGVWDSSTSTFTQAVTSTLAAGYVDLSGPELSITLNQITNATYTNGTLMALAIFTNGSSDSQALNYSPTYNFRAVLIDPLWQAVGFANNANMVNYVFSSNTTAVVGSYSYNGGADVITLVPEPATGSLLLLGGVGLVALRRLRKV